MKGKAYAGHLTFSAPELVHPVKTPGKDEHELSDKADVWSLGCVLYYLIVKSDPFEG